MRLAEHHKKGGQRHRKLEGSARACEQASLTETTMVSSDSSFSAGQAGYLGLIAIGFLGLCGRTPGGGRR